MADRREGSIRTAKGVFYIIGFATNTFGREVLQRPSIVERYGITKIPLVKGEPMTFQWQGRKPGGCTLFSRSFKGSWKLLDKVERKSEKCRERS